jgi:hypothetical protein
MVPPRRWESSLFSRQFVPRTFASGVDVTSNEPTRITVLSSTSPQQIAQQLPWSEIMCYVLAGCNPEIPSTHCYTSTFPGLNATCEICVGTTRMRVQYLCEKRLCKKSKHRVPVLQSQIVKLFVQLSINSDGVVIEQKKNRIKTPSTHRRETKRNRC